MTVRGLEGSVVGQYVYSLVPAAAFTTGGASAALDAGGYGSLTAVATFSTGTLATSLRVWLQGSYDGGTTWYGLPLTNVFKTLVHNTGFAEAAGGLTANMPSLVVESTVVTTTAIYVGTVNNPPPHVRAAWNFAGASATQTFGITCVLSMGHAN